MQTFLPYADFKQSAAVLDRQRLGKQRSEGLILLETLIVGREAWSHHPCTIMWKGCEITLWKYVSAVCSEWIGRGYEDTVNEKVNELMFDSLKYGKIDPIVAKVQPWWLGVEGFHMSHRSNLVRKDESFYGKIWPDQTPTLPYVWPEWQPPVPVKA